MAERMRRSHREIPAAAAQREVGATVLLDTADQLTERSGVGVSPFSVLAGLTVMALSRHRWLNAVFDEPTASLTLRRRVNLAFAVDTPYGLMAPVVAHAETLTIVELAAEMNRLAAAARDRRVTPAEVSGATFTITNHGSVGTDDGMPIVNPPQVAILAVGAIRPRPFVVDGLVVAAPTVHLTCAFDHRCLDGGQAGRFLGDLADLLAAPVDPDVALGEG